MNRIASLLVAALVLCAGASLATESTAVSAKSKAEKVQKKDSKTPPPAAKIKTEVEVCENREGRLVSDGKVVATRVNTLEDLYQATGVDLDWLQRYIDDRNGHAAQRKLRKAQETQALALPINDGDQAIEWKVIERR